MSSVAKTNTFVAGTNAEAAKVNQNFDDVVTYINDEVIVRDGSKAFTAVPSGPATNPSTDNQFTRKKYVDDQDASITATVTANKTAQDSGFLVRPVFSGVNNQIVKAGEVVVTLNSDGEADVTFPTAFPNSLIAVIVSNGDMGSGTPPQKSTAVGVIHSSKSKTGFRIKASDWQVVYGLLGWHANMPFRVTYIAVGT